MAVFGTGVDVLYPKENSRLAEQILALGGALISEFPLGTFAAPQKFSIRKSHHQRHVDRRTSRGSSRVQRHPHHSQMRSRAESRPLRCPGNVTNRNSWGPNTLIKQGAKLGATWEDVWEELAENIRLALTPARPDESKQAETASLFPVDSPLSPHKRRIFALLKADEATHIDETVDRLETEMSSSEIFAALFELELAEKVRQLPGKNFVKTF